jgi:hypothetical protein
MGKCNIGSTNITNQCSASNREKSTDQRKESPTWRNILPNYGAGQYLPTRIKSPIEKGTIRWKNLL